MVESRIVAVVPGEDLTEHEQNLESLTVFSEPTCGPGIPVKGIRSDSSNPTFTCTASRYLTGSRIRGAAERNNFQDVTTGPSSAV